MNFSDRKFDQFNSLRTPDPMEMGETPGEGTGPTRTAIPVGRVPTPGESEPSIFLSARISKLGIRSSELGNSERGRSTQHDDGLRTRPAPRLE